MYLKAVYKSITHAIRQGGTLPKSFRKNSIVIETSVGCSEYQMNWHTLSMINIDWTFGYLLDVRATKRLPRSFRTNYDFGRYNTDN